MCVSLVCLLASGALTVSVVAATRQPAVVMGTSAPGTAQPTPNPPVTGQPTPSPPCRATNVEPCNAKPTHDGAANAKPVGF